MVWALLDPDADEPGSLCKRVVQFVADLLPSSGAISWVVTPLSMLRTSDSLDESFEQAQLTLH